MRTLLNNRTFWYIFFILSLMSCLIFYYGTGVIEFIEKHQNIKKNTKKIENIWGIKWGTDITDLPDMRCILSAGTLNMCYRIKERHDLAGANIDVIFYWFSDYKLNDVSIIFKNNEDYLVVKKYLEFNFGPGEESYELEGDFSWRLSDCFLSLKRKGSVGLPEFEGKPTLKVISF